MLWALPKIDVAMAVVGSAQNRLCYDGTQQQAVRQTIVS